MKVIGLIDKEDYNLSKVLVEVTKDELANIRGEWGYANCRNNAIIKVGSVIKVNVIYQNARKIIDYYRNFKNLIGDFGKNANFLKKILDAKTLEEEVKE